MLGYASSAGAFAFNTASSYVFRPDASTSNLPDDIDVKNGNTMNSRSSRPSSSSANRHVNGTSNGVRADVTRRSNAHRRNSQLPKSNNRTGSSNGDPATQQTPNGNGSRSTSENDKDKKEGEALVGRINQEDDLYLILGVSRRCKTDEIRRAFLGRSRLIHPDKLPDYPESTPAFQRLSYAYETLSKPASRRIYDLGGGKSFDSRSSRPDAEAGLSGDETLNGVLRNVFTEFLAGDFEMIRVFVNALNDGNPGLNLGDEAVDNLEGAFRRVREVLLSGQKYMRIIKFELIRLYEIQHSLRSLGYFDVVGRFRLTLALTRVTLEIPMVLDRAMREEIPSVPQNLGPAAQGKEDDEREKEWNGEHGELQRRGLLGPRIKGVLVLACKVLEKGEKFGT